MIRAFLAPRPGLVLAGLVALLAGCRTPPVARPYPPPSAAELLAALRARAAGLRTLRATGKVDHMEGSQRVKVKVALLAARGGRLRIEAESPLGGPIAVLSSDGARFALLDVQKNRFFVGPANACNVARMTHVWLAPDDVVSVLMGGAPLDGEPRGVSWDAGNGGREVLTLGLPDGGQETLRLDARERRWDLVEAERRDPAGQVLWRVRNQGFADRGGGVRLPESMTIEEPPHKADAEIKLRAVEANPALDDALFRLPPPSGLAAEPSDC